MFAKDFALNVHVNDAWGNAPYSTHLELVVDKTADLGKDLPGVTIEKIERLTDIAWLHDTLEDHPAVENDLFTNFGTHKNTLSLLSRKNGETYDDYIQRIVDSENDEAILVKVADLLVNKETAPESLSKRYENALAKLEPLLT